MIFVQTIIQKVFLASPFPFSTENTKSGRSSKILSRSRVLKAQLLDSVSNQNEEEASVVVKSLAELEDTLEIIEQAVIKARECVNLRTLKQITQYKKNIGSFSNQGRELNEEFFKFDEEYRFIPKGTQLIRVGTPPFFSVVLAKENFLLLEQFFQIHLDFGSPETFDVFLWCQSFEKFFFRIAFEIFHCVRHG